MDVDNRPPPLPAKLRWRPYANGNSLKSKKPKKSDALKQKQAPNLKAVASKVRGTQYYTGKTRTVEVQLQWEEAETVESMSQGGHPHNHHQSHQHLEQGSRDSSPSASSVTSSSTADGHSKSRSSSGDSNSSGVFASIQRAMSSLPSPPPSQPLTTRLDLVGGQSDFGLFRASIPGLTDSGFLNSGLALDSASTNNAYQIAVNALFQSRNFRNPTAFHTPALLHENSANVPLTNADSATSAAAPTAVSSSAALLGSTTINQALLADPNRMLSGSELINIATLNELLTSCGFVDANSNPTSAPNSALGTQIFPSPANSSQSLDSSPLGGLMDLDGSAGYVRGVSPYSNSFSPMAISNNSFEALLAQSIAPGQATETSSTATGADNAYTELLQELASPFNYLAGDANIGSNPASWPSLFDTSAVKDQNPTSVETLAVASALVPQRMEIATQTDGSYSPMSGTSSTRGSTQGSPLANSLGLSDEELDPDWLNFLDEASPLFTDMDMSSPSSSGDEEQALPSATSKPSSRDRSMWNWAEELLKPGAKTPTGTRGGFPTSNGSYSSMGGVVPGGQIGGGGLVRTLRTVKPKGPTEKETIAESSRDGQAEKSGTAASTTAKAATATAPASATPVEDNSDSQFGGLMAMIRGLWVTKKRGGDD